jgi:hypothetical protein
LTVQTLVVALLAEAAVWARVPTADIRTTAAQTKAESVFRMKVDQPSE